MDRCVASARNAATWTVATNAAAHLATRETRASPAMTTTSARAPPVAAELFAKIFLAPTDVFVHQVLRAIPTLSVLVRY